MNGIDDIQAKIVSVEERRSGGGCGRAGSNGVIYIWDRKGETILENMFLRRVRPYTLWRKKVLPQLVERFPELAGFRISWSQRAGCSCPCSPGFIVLPPKDRPWVRFRSDLSVTVEWEGGRPATPAEASTLESLAALEAKRNPITVTT